MLGSTTSLVRPAAAGTYSPFTKFFRSATLAPGCTVAVKVRLLGRGSWPRRGRHLTSPAAATGSDTRREMFREQVNPLHIPCIATKSVDKRPEHDTMTCEGGPHGAHPGDARDPRRAERGASTGQPERARPRPRLRGHRPGPPVEADYRAAPGGRPPLLRLHRQGGRAVRGRGPAAGPAAGRGRGHADRRGDRPADARLQPADHDRHQVRRGPGAGRRPAGGHG